MDPAQLASEACKRFAALHTSPNTPAASSAESLLEAFHHLATLDGWAKIAMTRLAADPQDSRAHQELRRSLEQAARLHPQFTRRLADVLADRPAVKTALSNTGALPLQHLRGKG